MQYILQIRVTNTNFRCYRITIGENIVYLTIKLIEDFKRELNSSFVQIVSDRDLCH
jgi:hypothetical protein